MGAKKTERETVRWEQARQSDKQTLPGTSGNLRSFKSSMFVAKVKREEPVTMATPVP